MPPLFEQNQENRPQVGVVGPCSSGKTTLIESLKLHGIHARHIAQEHSFVPYMWQRLADPKSLIYLDVSYPVSMQRRRLDLSLEEFEDQKNRLHHARQHADLYLLTDALTPKEVLDLVLRFLKLDNPSNQEYNATR
jgi:hypothetical protein